MTEREGSDNVGTLKQLWVVANLPELHDKVHERAGRVRVAHIRRLLQKVLNGNLGEERLVQRPLPRTKIDINVNLNLVAQFMVDMALDAAQHEWLQDHVKTPELVLIESAALVFGGVLDVFGEPFIELIVGVEETGHDEME